MTPFLRKLIGMNWVLFAAMITLAVFGIVAVYSATFFRTEINYWHRQVTWVAIGIAVFLATSLIDYRWAKFTALPMYLVSIVFLVLTYTKLGEEHGGAKAWLNLRVLTFQPSQLCVIAGILVVGLFLSQFRKLHPFLKLVIVGAIIGGPMALILKQPDFGMTMVWVPVIMAMLFLGGIPKRYLIVITLIGLAALPLAINFVLKPYQRDRIVSFIDPEIDPKGTSWAINQSLIAIGSGGFAGKGFKAPNTQVEQGFLPGTTVHTDYIFSAIAEQWGFVGAVALLGVFAVLLLSCLFTGYHAADEFGLLITIGFAAQIFFHVYQNVGMTVALMPITGLPLPLVSYGGTFIVMIMFGLGLINSVWVHRKAIS